MNGNSAMRAASTSSFSAPAPIPAMGRRGGANGDSSYHKLPLSASAAPVQPLTKIADTRYQAHFTTYPSRLRLGTSGLMQPMPEPTATKKRGGAGANGIDGLDPGLSAMAPAGKRARAQVNYAEIEGMQDAGGTLGIQQREQSLPTTHYSMMMGGANSNATEDSDGRGGRNDSERQIWGDGKSYLGTLPPGNLVQVQRARTGRMAVFSEEELESQAERRACPVPIQIDLDAEGFKIRDAFVWNAHEKLVSPEMFAKTFCDDLDLDSSHVTEVSRQIREQVQEATGVATMPLRSEAEEKACAEKDLRVVLNLDVQIGALRLVDKVDWDLSSSLSPELFAMVLCRDLSLSSAARPLIAHAVHEELLRIKRHLIQMGVVPLPEDATARARGSKALEGTWRDWHDTSSFGPRVQVLTLDEMDKRDEEREREMRKNKKDKLGRSARRR